MDNLISIVLPIYNGEKYMRESIDSVLAQTYRNWELLILDDCSTDATSKIAQEYVKQDSRIRYYRNEENLRLPKNLNRGFSLARGQYLTWTSDDNRYKPHALEVMLSALQSAPDADFTFASCRVIDGEGREIEYMMVSEDSKRRIVGSNPVGACFLYTRKAYEAVGEYDPDYVLVEDFDYWQRVMARFQAVAIPEILYEYRFHEGALTSTMKKDLFHRNLEKILLKNRSAFGRLSLLEAYYYYMGLHNCRQGIGKSVWTDEIRYRLLCAYYLCRYRVPNKLRRMLSLKKS